MVAALALLHRFRDAAPSVQAAIACVAGRLWTYHRRYDDVMLIFLLHVESHDLGRGAGLALA